jgi:hypothetical protein
MDEAVERGNRVLELLDEIESQEKRSQEDEG